MVTSQEKAYSLLKKNPAKLLNSSEYQQVIKKVVTKFFNKGFFAACSPKEIQKQVKTTLLNDKLEQMKQNYQPEFNLQTKYFERLVFSLCKEMSESNQPTMV